MPRIRRIEHVVSKIARRPLSNSTSSISTIPSSPAVIPRHHSSSQNPPYTNPPVEDEFVNHSNAFILRQKPIQRHNARAIFPSSQRDTVAGRYIAIKDNICTKDFPTTCASRMLKDFRSPYDATVVQLLRESGAHVIGKTNLDEFGMGSHSTNSDYGAVKNIDKSISPSDPAEWAIYSAGGSSGGSAVAVSEGHCCFALGTDTGGSVRLPAAYCGVHGFKPSYGRLSRWGVVAYANSLDTVGIFSRGTDQITALYNVLNRYDPKDPTSMTPAIRERAQATVSHLKNLRIGVPTEYNIAEISDEVREAWVQVLELLQSLDHTIVPISLPTTKHALSAYYVLAPAEASSNLAKYDGVRYGNQASGPDGTDGVLFSRSRGEGFGDEVKRRILLGSYTLSAEAIDNYFIRAQRVRRLVQQDFDRVFRSSSPLSKTHSSKLKDQGVDFIICPTAPTLAPTLKEATKQSPIQSYMNDVFTVPASLAGLPALSVPTKHPEGGFPRGVGIQILGQYGDDDDVLRLGVELDKYFRARE